MRGKEVTRNYWKISNCNCQTVELINFTEHTAAINEGNSEEAVSLAVHVAGGLLPGAVRAQWWREGGGGGARVEQNLNTSKMDSSNVNTRRKDKNGRKSLADELRQTQSDTAKNNIP